MPAILAESTKRLARWAGRGQWAATAEEGIWVESPCKQGHEEDLRPLGARGTPGVPNPWTFIGAYRAVEEIERWDKDNDLTLAEDLKLEVPEDYEDLDPSTPGTEIEKAGEDVPGVEKSADEAAMDEDNASPPEGEKGVEEPRPPNPVPVEAFLPEGTEAPVSQAGVNILEPLEKQI